MPRVPDGRGIFAVLHETIVIPAACLPIRVEGRGKAADRIIAVRGEGKKMFGVIVRATDTFAERG